MLCLLFYRTQTEIVIGTAAMTGIGTEIVAATRTETVTGADAAEAEVMEEVDDAAEQKTEQKTHQETQNCFYATGRQR